MRNDAVGVPRAHRRARTAAAELLGFLWVAAAELLGACVGGCRRASGACVGVCEPMECLRTPVGASGEPQRRREGDPPGQGPNTAFL